MKNTTFLNLNFNFNFNYKTIIIFLSCCILWCLFNKERFLFYLSKLDELYVYSKNIDYTQYIHYINNAKQGKNISIDFKGYFINKNEVNRRRKLVIYCHGGGYVYGTAFEFLDYVDYIFKNKNCDVFSLDYTLYNPDKALNELSSCVSEFFNDYSEIILMGSSAGANIIIRYNLIQPPSKQLKMILIAPWINTDNLYYDGIYNKFMILLLNLFVRENINDKTNLQKMLDNNSISLEVPILLIYSKYEPFRNEIERFFTNKKIKNIKVEQIVSRLHDYHTINYKYGFCRDKCRDINSSIYRFIGL